MADVQRIALLPLGLLLGELDTSDCAGTVTPHSEAVTIATADAAAAQGIRWCGIDVLLQLCNVTAGVCEA